MRVLHLSVAGLLSLALSSAYGQEQGKLHAESWERAKHYLAQGKFADAKRVGEELLKNHPRNPDIYVLMGIASLRSRDVEAAKVYLRKAIDLDPDHVEARSLLGWLQMEIRRDYGAAAEQYRKVVKLMPNSPEAHNNLGVALKKMGEMEGAIEAFSRGLALRSDYGEAWSNRGWAFAEQKKWSEARRDFEQGLKINPRDEGALYGLSRVLRETRDYGGAQQALRSLMVESPNFVYWLEWGELQLVRFYWVFLLVAGAVFLHSRYKNKMKVRRQTDGR